MTIRAVVIGGGIGGACAALALTEIGARVQLYEAAERSADGGGWVTLGPTASTVLDRLGIGDSVRRIGFPVLRVTTVDVVTGRTTSFDRRELGHRSPSTHVWRRDLLSVLRDRLDIVGVRCRYGTRADPAQLTAELLVGADGAYSVTRQRLGDARDPDYIGQVIRYGHNPIRAEGLPTGELCFWAHPDGVVGYVGDDRDGSFWFSRRNTASPATPVDADTFVAPLRDTPVAEVLAGSVSPPAVGLYQLEPDGIWHNGDAVLIGDAAHALSPSAGRGATSAIEDAIVLAGAIRAGDSIATALHTYTALRRPIARAALRPTPGNPIRVAATDLAL